MESQDTGSNPKQKQHKTFRLSSTAIKQLKEVAVLFGSSEAAVLEKMIEFYYNQRIELFNGEVANRLKNTGNTK